MITNTSFLHDGGKRTQQNLLRLVPGGRVRQHHHVTFGLDVGEDGVPAVKGPLAAVAAVLVDLPPDEVHQLDLVVEAQI